MRDFQLIANPTSGQQGAPEMATRALALLRERGAVADLQLTTARGDAHRIAAEAVARGAGVVVGCGGDGTLQEIATALDGSATTFGILPGGRCNDFAHAMGLSKTDPIERLVETLLDGAARPMDLGALESHRFLTVATLGFDSTVSRFVESHTLPVRGTLAYLLGVLCEMPRFRAPVLRMRGDFGEIEGRFFLAATGNTRCYGGAMNITPDARPDDGLFHLCLVEDLAPGSVLRLLPRVMEGSHVDHPAVRTLTTRTLAIETPEGPQWICADGESLGQTPCEFQIRRAALRVLCPR